LLSSRLPAGFLTINGAIAKGLDKVTSTRSVALTEINIVRLPRA
jgi:hypothetical protein